MAVVTSASNIVMLNSGLFSFNNPYFVCGWVVSTSFAADQNIVVPYANSAAYDGVGIHITSGIIYVYSNTTSINGITLVTNRPYFIALVRESASLLKLYVDNVLVATNTDNIAGRAASNQLNFGYWGNASDGYYDPFTGRYWNWMAGTRALTLNEIIQQRAMTAPISKTGLYGWWPFAPGATDRLRDLSGNGHTLTNVGTPTDTNSLQPGWGLPALAYYPLPVASGVTGSGSATAELDASGNARVDELASGSASAQLNATGNAQVSEQGIGAATAQANASGSANATQSAVGTATAQANASGNAQVAESAVGMASAQLNANGNAQVDQKASGAASAQLNTSGNGQADQKASGTATAQLNASGFAQVGGAVTGIGSATAELDASGNARVDQKASGTASAQLNANGNAQVSEQGIGAATAQANASGSANATQSAVGTATAQANASGNAQVSKLASGSASSQLNANGNAQVDQKASGSASAQLTASGYAVVGGAVTGIGAASAQLNASGFAFIGIPSVNIIPIILDSSKGLVPRLSESSSNALRDAETVGLVPRIRQR